MLLTYSRIEPLCLTPAGSAVKWLQPDGREDTVEISVNGEKREVPDGATLRELLELLEIQRGRVAVERNLEIVPKAQFDTCCLTDGDRLEIVTLVGGG